MPKEKRSFFILHSSFFILHCSFFILIALSLVSCNNSTSPKTGSLSGTVTLVNDTGNSDLDPVDFSGITVALYELAVLDTSIVRINQEYPGIGVQINQQTEFDHRLQSAVAVSTTNALGEYLFSSVPIGTYNLIVFKEGWGIRFLYEIPINEHSVKSHFVKSDEGSNRFKTSTELYPIIHLPSVINSDIRFKTNRVYSVDNDTIVFGDALVEESVYIFITENSKLDFYGDVSYLSESGWWNVNCIEGLYSVLADDEMGSFDKVGFHKEGHIDISRLNFSNSKNGMFRSAGTMVFSNSIVKSNQNQALLLNGDQTSISDCLIWDNQQKGITAFNGLELIRSILLKSNDACFLSETSATISNCAFIDNYIGLRPFYGNITIEHNYFDRNSNAIAPCASDPIIMNNSFYNNDRDIELNGYYVQSSTEYCNPTIESNNFFGNKWYVHLKGENSVYAAGAYQYNGVNTNQDYPFNYLKEANLTNHVFDANNPLANDDLIYIANFPSRRQVSVSGAGIR